MFRSFWKWFWQSGAAVPALPGTTPAGTWKIPGTPNAWRVPGAGNAWRVPGGPNTWRAP